VVADLTAEARIALLEQLLDVALASGALQVGKDRVIRTVCFPS
jgi:uncharacterized tellurite resistance protein B-like protein